MAQRLVERTSRSVAIQTIFRVRDHRDKFLVSGPPPRDGPGDETVTAPATAHVNLKLSNGISTARRPQTLAATLIDQVKTDGPPLAITASAPSSARSSAPASHTVGRSPSAQSGRRRVELKIGQLGSKCAPRLENSRLSVHCFVPR